MEILVLGGNRFFGKRLVKILVANGHSVTALNRGNLVNEIKCKHIYADRKTLKSQDLAGAQTKWDIVFDNLCYDAKDAKTTLEAIAPFTDRYIFTSSQSVYSSGKSIPEKTFSPESYDLVEAAKYTCDYAEGKRQAEATLFQNNPFKQLVAIRLPIVLGSDDYTERLLWHILRILHEQPMFFRNIDSRFSLIDSIDAAEGIYKVMQNNYNGAINLAAPEPISLRSLIQIIEKAAGKSAAFSKDSKDQSVMDIANDWYMNTDLALSMGIQCKKILEWLPLLVDWHLQKIQSTIKPS